MNLMIRFGNKWLISAISINIEKPQLPQGIELPSEEEISKEYWIRKTEEQSFTEGANFVLDFINNQIEKK